MASGSGCRDCGRAFPGAHVHELCAACIGKRLAERVRDVVEELLPNGKYEQGGREYRVGSTAGDAGRSLDIEIGGPKSGLWYDHSAGEGGDLLDLIAHCIGGGAREALHWARQWLGQPERQRPVRPLPAPAPREDEERTRKRAEKIWHQAVPLHHSIWRWPSPYQITVAVCQGVLGSASTSSSLGSRSPTTRGRPSRRGGFGGNGS